MIELLRFLRALAEPNRMKIVKLLSAQELCVCDLTRVLGVCQPSISQHLRRLKSAGIVKERREGQWVYYSLDLERIGKYQAAWQDFWVRSPEIMNGMEDEWRVFVALEEEGKVKVC